MNTEASWVAFPLFEVAPNGRTGRQDPATQNATSPVLVRRFIPRWKVGQGRWLVIQKISALMGMSASEAEGVQQEVYS